MIVFFSRSLSEDSKVLLLFFLCLGKDVGKT